jgi:hypothetical protein
MSWKERWDSFINWNFGRETPNFLLPICVVILVPWFMVSCAYREPTYLLHKPSGVRVIPAETTVDEYRLGLQRVKWYNQKINFIQHFLAKQSDIISITNSYEKDKKALEELKKKLGE